MTDPNDEPDGGRDDDYGWEREDEQPSAREQLARLREELPRAGRGGRRPEREPPRRSGFDDQAGGGADLPGSLDRAIARVGGLLDDVGSSSSSRGGARDPYADFGDASPPSDRDPYDAPDAGRGARDPYDDYAEPEPAPSEPPRRERPRRTEAAEEEQAYGLRPGRRGGPARRERRAARARKEGQSFDDGYGRGATDEFEREGRRPHRAGPAPDDLSGDDFGSRGRPEDALGRARFEPGEFDLPEYEPAEDSYEDDYDRAPRETRRADREPAGREATGRELAARDRRGSSQGRGRGRGPGSKASRAEPEIDPAEAAAQAQAMRGRGSSPFGSLERLLAGRYLRARRKEGFISVIAMLSLIGITLAVAVLIVVMSVMNGFRAELISKIVGVNGHLIVQPLDRALEDYDDVSRKIRSVAGVTRAAPMIEGQAFATSSRGGTGALVRGLSKTDLLSLEKVSVSPETSIGSLANYGAVDGVAIGIGLARKLGVSVGDAIDMISPQGSVTPFGVAPKRRAFDVLYVFQMGMSNYDDALIFMPIDEAQTFFNRPGRADFIEVQVATPDRLDGYVEDIEDTVGRAVGVTTWMDSNGVFIGALETEQSVMFLILSMLILIASLIIISGLIMLVKEKGPDIAILRTMGVSRGGVMRVFFMCGATIGLLGAALGVALGVVVALNVNDIKEFIEATTGARLFPSEVYLFSQLPSRLDWGDVGFTLMITIGLSFVATLYPAWRAARMDPVEALRYE